MNSFKFIFLLISFYQVNCKLVTLSKKYSPAVIQALGYYVEQLQYEQLDKTTVEPPFSSNEVVVASSIVPIFIAEPATTPATTTTSRPKPPRPVTQRPITTTTTATTTPTSTSRRPTTAVSQLWWQTTQGPATFWWQKSTTPINFVEPTTSRHPPGYYSPTKRPAAVQRPAAFQNNKPIYIESTTRRPQIINELIPPAKPISDYLITETNRDDKENFFNWFFQHKTKQLNYLNQFESLLDPLPREVLALIENERENLPALMDQDNVEEFLKKYDDLYARRTGNKKVPVTAPFVNFIILYDIMKRESKKLGLNNLVGYDPEFVKVLAETSSYSSARQLYTLMKRMLDGKETDRQDIIKRCETILRDLSNPNSVTSKAMLYIPALKYLV